MGSADMSDSVRIGSVFSGLDFCKNRRANLEEEMFIFLLLKVQEDVQWTVAQPQSSLGWNVGDFWKKPSHCCTFPICLQYSAICVAVLVFSAWQRCEKSWKQREEEKAGYPSQRSWRSSKCMDKHLQWMSHREKFESYSYKVLFSFGNKHHLSKMLASSLRKRRHPQHCAHNLYFSG